MKKGTRFISITAAVILLASWLASPLGVYADSATSSPTNSPSPTATSTSGNTVSTDANAEDAIDETGLSKYDYEKYLEDMLKAHPDQTRPETEISVLGKDYVSTDMNGGKLLTYGKDNSAVVTLESGKVTYKITVPKAGFYNMALLYTCVIDDKTVKGVLGKRSSMIREMLIDNKDPFFESKNLYFERFYKNGPAQRDTNGNDIRPEQIEDASYGVAEQPLMDYMGVYSDPLLFYFTAGEHTITLNSVREPLILNAIKVYNKTNNLPTYEEYKKSLGSVASGTQPIKIQAESQSVKNDIQLFPTYDRTSPISEPQSPSNIRLNTVGNNYEWWAPGAWLKWDFNATSGGLYKISMRLRQNEFSGKYVTRKLYIDGKIPFKEAENIRINYDPDWQIYTISDAKGNPYQFNLTPGKHTIKLEGSMGDMSDYLIRGMGITKKLQTAYQQLFFITGSTPDTERDYQFPLVAKEAMTIFKEQAAALAKLQADIEKTSSLEGGSFTTTLFTLRRQLESFVARPSTIAKNLLTFQGNIQLLQSWNWKVQDQPISLDYIDILPLNAALPAANATFWGKMKFEAQTFWASFFTDYTSFSSTGENKEIKDTIVVWNGSGTSTRDQSVVIKMLADSYFTPKTKIAVDVKMVASANVMQAMLAGKGPDVTMLMTWNDIMNLALRGAVVDLSKYQDEKQIEQRFNPSAMTNVSYKGHVYGLPDIEDFSVLYYRTDIMKVMGLKIPKTWDDVLELMPELQKKHMTFGAGNTSNFAQGTVGTTSGFACFLNFLYQNNGKLYNDDDLSALGNIETVAMFKKFTQLFTQWQMPFNYEFSTRFGRGEMPMGVAPYSMYNQVMRNAFQIQGLWDITVVPGTPQKDGTLNRSVANNVFGSIIMETSKKKDEAWEFLKWWTDADTQVAFSREMETIQGPLGRVAVSNKAALDRLPWMSSTAKQIKNQWQYVKGIPEVPGSYYTSREFDFAFQDSVIKQNEDPAMIFMEKVRLINAELADKQAEFRKYNVMGKG